MTNIMTIAKAAISKSMKSNLLFSLLLCGLLSACGKTPPQMFKSVDISGSTIGADFQLIDQHGKTQSLENFRNKVVVVFFGFTHCPDICPTTMNALNMAMKQLGKAAEQVQVLFITVDPERDTQTRLAKYTQTFNPNFLGLRGTLAQTRKVTSDFKAAYSINTTVTKDRAAHQAHQHTADNYTVDHTAGSYLFDKAGKIRLFAETGTNSATFAHDMHLLLNDN